MTVYGVNKSEDEASSRRRTTSEHTTLVTEIEPFEEIGGLKARIGWIEIYP